LGLARTCRSGDMREPSIKLNSAKWLQTGKRKANSIISQESIKDSKARKSYLTIYGLMKKFTKLSNEERILKMEI
jgi:hypothetical protein